MALRWLAATAGCAALSLSWHTRGAEGRVCESVHNTTCNDAVSTCGNVNATVPCTVELLKTHGVVLGVVGMCG